MTESIADWLTSLGLGEHAQRFAKNDIDLSVLRHLSDEDLEKIGITLGHRRKILHSIALLDPAPSRLSTSGSTVVPAESDRVTTSLLLTVLHCRLADAVAFAGQLEPEDMRLLRRNVQLACGSVIRTYNGFLAKLLPEGLIAFFGYPNAEEDDAERAVRAALEICVGVEMIETPAGVPPTVQIGVASGPVNICASSHNLAFGDQVFDSEVPALAARLQTIAEPGKIIISGVTRGQIGEYFVLSDLGYCEIKGLAPTKRPI